MQAVFWKELKSYFYSPIAYILIGLFILLTSIFFFPSLYYQVGTFTDNLSSIAYFLIFIIPILTMKILAEDRKNGTEVLLITSPSSLTKIVLGKYLASFVVFIILTALTWIYPLVQVAFGGQINIQLIGAYVGFILLGGSFLAVGIFASSLTESQVVAAVISFISLLIMLIANQLTSFVGSGIVGKIIANFLDFISLFSRYDDFTKGIFGLAPIVYYLSFIAVFIFLTIRVIEKRRWSQG